MRFPNLHLPNLRALSRGPALVAVACSLAVVSQCVGPVSVPAAGRDVAEARDVSAASAGASAGARAAGLPRWDWPTPTPHRIARPFVAPETPYSSGHRGLDLRAASDAVVRAPADGTVAFVGVVVDRPVVTIDHGGGWKSSYEPVSPVDESIVVGLTLGRGEAFGLRDGSHGSCGECIHFGVRLNGAYVSPLLLIDPPAPSVLLPLE